MHAYHGCILLPAGIVHYSIGEQPKDIDGQIIKLINKYAMGEAKVLMPVMIAATDIAANKAFAVVREHDPEGKRTLGVITRLDS